VVGFDLNDYYDVALKQARLDVLKRNPAFQFVHADLADAAALNRLFEQHNFEVVVNLAARADVRYSLTNPQACVESNLVGFVNILEACRHHGAHHLLYASSSSVYGGVTKMPFFRSSEPRSSVERLCANQKIQRVLVPRVQSFISAADDGSSLLHRLWPLGPSGYGAVHLYPCDAGRKTDPDFQLRSHGTRFHYIDDIVDGVFRLTDKLPQPDNNWNGEAPDPGRSNAPCRLYNVGNSLPVPLMQLIDVLEAKFVAGIRNTKVLTAVNAVGQVRRAIVSQIAKTIARPSRRHDPAHRSLITLRGGKVLRVGDLHPLAIRPPAVGRL